MPFLLLFCYDFIGIYPVLGCGKFKIESNLDLKKFRNYLSTEIGEDNLPNDAYIKQTIRDICNISYGGKLYRAEFMLSSEKKNKLQAYIDGEFASGKTALYYKALFEKFQVDFSGECIYSDDMLKSYLQETLKGKCYFYNDYISNQQGSANNVDEEIREIFINKGEPISLMEIYEKLPHISEDKIEKTVKCERKYIPNGKKKYFYVDVVDLNSSDISKIENIIEKHISQREYILNSELFSNIEKLYPEILEKMSFISDLGRFSVIKYEFEKKYAFNGKIISRKGNEISYAVVYGDFAKDTPVFSVDDLKLLKSELDDTPIKFDEIYSNSVRVSDTAFVSKSYANFDVKSTDEAISRYCTGDYMPLVGITQFGSFPYCGFTEHTWNSFMLESYVFAYSKDYMLLHSAFNENSCVGAIVKRDSEIVDYYDVLVREIAYSGINLNKNEALELLQKRGFIVDLQIKVK